MPELDEKCLIMLETVYQGEKPVTLGLLYGRTKPTTYPTMMKRLDEMQEAELIEVKRLDCMTKKYEITDFGIEVMEELMKKS
ncbi:MAG: hypothetical protein V1818_01840 [Candidatus Aenigmatarchaeota archaeon]